MAVTDSIRNAVSKSSPPPKDVDERVEQANRNLENRSASNNECLEFWRGNQYVYRSKENYLVKQATLLGEGKARHRIRTTRNMIQGIVRHEVSYATQRIPSYQVIPSTGDPEDMSAAAVAEQVAYYGYDKWGIQRVSEMVVSLAVVLGEGFAWPYWDSDVGPFVDDGEGGQIGLGDVAISYFSPNEVGWEPGCKYPDARWFIIRRALPVDQIENMPGFIGKEKINPDANTDPMSSGSFNVDSKTAFVTDYLERPCAKYPQGRRYCICNGKLILEPEQYPYQKSDGTVIDKPVLHQLSWVIDPEDDRDIGLVLGQLDPQRTINDCTNKQLEWKNRALQPQMLAPFGAFPKKFRQTEQPGAVYVYNPVGGQTPQWQPSPPIPPELSALKAEALNDMQRMAAQTEIPSGVESGKAMQVLIEKDQNARQSFLARVAQFHSELMRHCLTLVSQYYNEPRILAINGRYGWSQISDFKGSDLNDQTNVVVMPDSIEPRTRQALEARVMAYADRQWIPPEKAMAAIEQGTAADLVDSYELDVGRAHRVLQRILAGPDAFLGEPMRPGPDGTLTDVPSWMPREYDNTQVHYSIFTDYAKTADYDLQEQPTQEAVNLYIQGLDWLKQQKVQQQAQMQAQTAESIGMANAAKPPSSDMPDMPKAVPGASDQPPPGAG